ncbi:MAG TPA: glycosyltransferase family 2 protein [Nanoarchaeota archaeon]|nr:glycosyltransferase family 2 protein [Nanoarchaeota archaeon]
MKKGILLPAYNEEKTIGKVIKECKRYVPEAFILVVDDGSKDKTAEISKKAGAYVISHEINKGKGEALKTGLRYFKERNYDAVVVIDADGQYSPKDIPRFFSALKNADIVTGYRDFSKVPLRHRLGNFVWKNTFNFLFGTKLKDTNCGFFGFSKKALQEIKNIHGGYIIENSILAEAIEKNLKIIQIPVKVEYNTKSGILRGIRVVFGVLVFILKEGIKYRLKKLIKRG